MKRGLMLVALLAAVAVVAILPLTSGAQTRGERKALFGAMTGAKEVSATGQRRAGDLNGRGSFTAIIDGTQICYGITVTNIASPVAAHIHRGGPNVAGPIVLPLQQPASGDPGASSECKAIPSALARAILKNPSRYYVNVHTSDFPGGAVRSQLFGQSR
ncbi:MAG TPA: CHRD domain-containing protein [Thermoleophilaceae bacterium]